MKTNKIKFNAIICRGIIDNLGGSGLMVNGKSVRAHDNSDDYCAAVDDDFSVNVGDSIISASDTGLTGFDGKVTAINENYIGRDGLVRYNVEIEGKAWMPTRSTIANFSGEEIIGYNSQARFLIKDAEWESSLWDGYVKQADLGKVVVRDFKVGENYLLVHEEVLKMQVPGFVGMTTPHNHVDTWINKDYMTIYVIPANRSKKDIYIKVDNTIMFGPDDRMLAARARRGDVHGMFRIDDNICYIKDGEYLTNPLGWVYVKDSVYDACIGGMRNHASLDIGITIHENGHDHMRDMIADLSFSVN